MIQKVGYLPPNKLMNDIRLSKNSVQTLDIGVLLFLMRRNNLALTLIFQRKSSRTNGKNFPGAGWWNVRSPGSTTPGASVKIMKFLSLPLSLWSLFPISILCSNAYEYRFLQFKECSFVLADSFHRHHHAELKSRPEILV